MSDSDPFQDRLQKHWDANSAEQNPMWQQKRRLASAMRLVIERLVPSNAPEEELRMAAEGLERYAERLRQHPRLRRVLGHPESANAGDVGAFFDQSPVIGLANPLAPPLSIAKTGDTEAEARGTFGSAYEGPPGSVHGGFIAASFDEVLGFVQSLGNNPGFTGTLTVRYRSPTPLHTELRFHAQFDRREGRKTFCNSTLHAGGTLCAEAEAIFVSARPGKLEELQQRRARLEKELGGETT
ncbi:MAG: PaaI family thioesterase [Myxococcota bacterium]|nr:thioesterase [Deltaproteobacteria bacterium]MCP4240678.1 PaaI family thioesterase [bacterium]MDP6076416.1 PaaI family thioesterase [Myxococcota bacterium]MDP6244433.1 PaaI family thioesterase [Myxococcota bacterium]MDP7074058.1 PaaI family thioesterase [Myxococcota bacterium]